MGDKKGAEFNELTAALYSKTRDEIIERIHLRDSAMSIFLSSVSIVGSVYGGLIAFLGTDPQTVLYGSYLLVIICLQCRSSASVISQHHVLIGAAEHYLVTEFEPKLRAQGYQIPQWDSSRSMLESKNFSISSRSKGHQMLIVRIAAASAIAFVFLQVAYGAHIQFLSKFLLNPTQIIGHIAANYESIIGFVLSIAATVIAIIAVLSARNALKNASKQRLKYLDGMNKYADAEQGFDNR